MHKHTGESVWAPSPSILINLHRCSVLPSVSFWLGVHAGWPPSESSHQVVGNPMFTLLYECEWDRSNSVYQHLRLRLICLCVFLLCAMQQLGCTEVDVVTVILGGIIRSE